MNDLNAMTYQSLFVSFDEGLSNERRDKVLSQINTFQSVDLDEQGSNIELRIQEHGLALRAQQFDKKAWVNISFHTGGSNHRRLYGGGKSQHLAKAVGLDQKKNIQIVDATAGLAGDSFVMACLGARVMMLERSEILALMIQDAIFQSEQVIEDIPDLAPVLSNMQFEHANAADWLVGQADESQEVIYLDPMFPERTKKAAVKKEMQVLQALLHQEQNRNAQNDEDEALLKLAIAKAKFRVVVKRPRHAPEIKGLKPGFQIEGKSTRFDIYPKRKII